MKAHLSNYGWEFDISIKTLIPIKAAKHFLNQGQKREDEELHPAPDEKQASPVDSIQGHVDLVQMKCQDIKCFEIKRWGEN